MSARAGSPIGALICGAVILGQLLSGCTPAAEPQATTSPSTVVSSPSEPSSPDTSATPSPVESPSLTADYALTINIEISGRKTIPNGEKINVRVGQQVILKEPAIPMMRSTLTLVRKAMSCACGPADRPGGRSPSTVREALRSSLTISRRSS